jgi:dsDNA-binding SOS-regulon protein
MKTAKRTAVFYNEAEHTNAMGEGHKTSLLFKEAKEELEAILEKPIENYEEFQNDILGYSIAEIKIKFPKAFDLGLSLEKTLAMLSIDLKLITRADGVLKTTPHKYCVCKKTGEAKADESKESFIQYAETDEQHERLDFANELIVILEKAYLYAPHVHKSNVTNGLYHIVVFDPQEGLIPNRFFVLEGIQ